MKLIFAIVQNDDVKSVSRALVENQISVTRISSSGGFLHSGNSILMIGVEKDRLQDALDLIEQKSHRRKTVTTVPSAIPGTDLVSTPIEVTVGGATVFVVDAEQFHRF